MPLQGTIYMQIPQKFMPFMSDWDYPEYLLIGGYGSGKSYAVAVKLILKCLTERRKVLVVRNVYDTMRDSCFSLFKDILSQMGLLGDKIKDGEVQAIVSPMQIRFPNGSLMAFRGMDKPEKLKSLHGVSIVWIEEATEISYDGYKELIGRVREKEASNHFILSCNPVGRENWIYQHYFSYIDDEGRKHVKVDEDRLYEKGTMVKNKVYYLHSVPTDNPFIPDSYIRRLDEMREYDPYLYDVARLGKFGTVGTRVLPQFEVADDPSEFKRAVMSTPESMRFIGLDFGFEESYNALVKCAVDDKNKWLYIYDELYMNHVTDDKFAALPEMQAIRDKLITADSAEPKTISYYRQMGFKMRPCKKYVGSRLANTRKMKRFKRIICSPKCKNTIRELRDLTYKKDGKGKIWYDEFNIDPHTFSALWYALDRYTVADFKMRDFNSQAGGAR